MLEQTDFSGITAIERSSENIVENLIVNNGYSEMEAVDLFYGSAIYSKLSDVATKLYERPWPEIYEMLKKELGL